MGGMFRSPRVDTSQQDAAIRRQEELLQQQQTRLTEQERLTAEREDSMRRLRAARTSGRALLLGGEETGTADQPMQTRLGG
jgi:hypothetical protein